jgi:hypothetical protein
MPLRNHLWAVGLAAFMVIELMLAMNPFLSNRLVEDRAYHIETALLPAEHVEGFKPQDRLLRLPTDGMMSGLRMDPVAGDLEPFENRKIRTQLIAWNLHTLLGNTASRTQLRRVSGITTFRYSRVERLWQIAIERGQVARALDLFAAGWIATSEDLLAAARQRQGIPGVVDEFVAVQRLDNCVIDALLESQLIHDLHPFLMPVGTMLLKHETDVLTRTCYGRTPDPHLTFVWNQSRHNLQESGFAAPTCAHHRHEFAFLNLERNILKG